MVALFFELVVYFNPQPGVVPDELVYQSQSYFFDSSTTGYGNLLHSVIYSQTSLCGEAWYQCVKSVNLIWDLIFAGSLSYLAFHVLKSFGVSAIVFLVTFFGPYVMYGQYFMPESMLAALLALAFVTLMANGNRPLLAATLFGFFMAAALLTKPHAFFVYLGLLAYVLISRLVSKDKLRSLRSDPLFLGLFIAIAVRSIAGISVFGVAGLNPLATYSSAVLNNEAPLETQEVQSNPELLQTEGVAALLSGLSNLAPGFLIMVALAAVTVNLTGHNLRQLLSDRFLAIAFSIFSSLLFMSAAFGAFLELRNLEETMFRAITRYWEYSIGLLVAVAVIYILKHRDQGTQRIKIGSWILLFVFGAFLILMPKEQTQADSGLLYPGSWLLVLSCYASVFISQFVQRKTKWLFNTAAYVLPVMFVIIGMSSTYRTFNYLNQEKAGYSVGRVLLEEIQRNPADVDRVLFVGDRVASTTAAFVAKLPYKEEKQAGFYSRIAYEDLPGSPRWVVTSKEVFILGDSSSQRVLGDMVLYEFGYPATIQSIDFDRLGVKYFGKFANTYWGAWVLGNQFEFVIPNDVEGDTLEILLLANEELTDRKVQIDFGDAPATGELQPDQIVTPVTLKKKLGDSWALTEVKVSALFSEAETLATKKKLGLGFAGFRVYNSVGGD